ncbi:MAG: aspartate aminotransferase family protein [Deltaproteobacteria bacterium]|nr:aspartate aminotransferase family protein [Deltaproteobacteria bacterium]
MNHKEKIDIYVMKTYGRTPVCFTRGEGCHLFDDQGRDYLDFLAGIAVCNLGHSHPGVSQAVCNQSLKLTHVSNLFYTEPQARVAELLVENSCMDRVFFCNSGAEANEGALKLSRLWGKKKLNGAYGVVTMEKSFHGRTMRTLTATGQEKVQKGFEPLVPGFKHVPFGDLAALDQAWDDNIAAVLVEPVQGEGGVVVPPEGYLAGLRKMCSERGALLMFDEIQTGLGRTGRLFAYEHYGVEPDVMTLAKALANGLPAGAVLARGEAAELFGPGSHATTFGAGPVIMEAARVVLETLTAPGFLAGVAETGAYFQSQLGDLAARHSALGLRVRGLGLMLGVELPVPGGALVGRLMERGLVVNCTQERILRFLPPLVVSRSEIDQLLAVLDEVLPVYIKENS